MISSMESSLLNMLHCQTPSESVHPDNLEIVTYLARTCSRSMKYKICPPQQSFPKVIASYPKNFYNSIMNST